MPARSAHCRTLTSTRVRKASPRAAANASPKPLQPQAGGKYAPCCDAGTATAAAPRKSAATSSRRGKLALEILSKRVATPAALTPAFPARRGPAAELRARSLRSCARGGRSRRRGARAGNEPDETCSRGSSPNRSRGERRDDLRHTTFALRRRVDRDIGLHGPSAAAARRVE